MKRTLLYLILCALLSNIQAQELARRAFLGVRLGAITEELKGDLNLPNIQGAHVQQVYDASTAKAAGLQADDVLVQLGESSVSNGQDFIAKIKAYQTGDKVDLTYYRNGKQEVVELELMGFPEESYEGASMIYRSVETETGVHRSIMSLPKEVKNPPVVYIIQGIDCGSIDAAFAPQSGIAQLVRHFNSKGFATYRVEKSGVGDSKGKACTECDFEEDKDIFLEGLKELTETAEVNPEEVYLLGLSMGGVWAPLIANEVKVKGVMAYGTIARPMAEYMLENSRRQALLGDVDVERLEQSLKNDAQLYHYLYNEKLSPEQIIEKHPFLEARMREISSERNPEAEIRHLHAGRLYQFQVQLHNTNISEAWKNLDAHVLAVWGKGDYVSNKEDHELIRDIVNTYHPGKGSLAMVDGNHWFETARSEAEAFENRRLQKQIPLNTEIFDTFSDWIN
ncbi:MAG: PDZ domain-containing protein, partial [Bacteroidota bacterium]